MTIQSELSAGFERPVDSSADQRLWAGLHLWVQQESGWNPAAVSRANNQGMVNGGLFSFGRAHLSPAVLLRVATTIGAGSQCRPVRRRRPWSPTSPT